MFERIARGWELMKQSWQVLRLDKELMLFPVLSSIACLMVMASFALPVILSPTVRELVLSSAVEGQGGEGAAVANNQGPVEEFQLNPQHIIPAILGFVFYLSTTFVIVFFNTALVCCAMTRFAGGNPTVAGGISDAIARLPQIFGWSLLTATVGTILRMVEERVPFVGKLVISLIGMAWAVVTFMVVPILAAEKLGPIDAVKRSAGLLRKTWGEALVGQVSLGGIQFLFLLPLVLLAVVVIAISGAMETAWPLAIGAAVGVFYVVLLAIIFSTLQQIFLAAVYQYAAAGSAPAGFSQELIESAFCRKGSK
jgi:hypothetical protein